MFYLILLGAAILGWFLVQNRHQLGRVVQQAVIWGFIFIGAVAAVGLWDDMRRSVGPPRAAMLEDGRIAVPRARDGHYYLTLRVNGEPVRFVVDTGATDIVLTRADAAAIGIDTERLAYFGQASTANGTVRTARVRLDSIAIEGHEDRRVSAWVNQGEMDTSLLGMGYLQRFERIEIAGDTLYLLR
jgi:aspartyl protease family protein